MLRRLVKTAGRGSVRARHAFIDELLWNVECEDPCDTQQAESFSQTVKSFGGDVRDTCYSRRENLFIQSGIDPHEGFFIRSTCPLIFALMHVFNRVSDECIVDTMTFLSEDDSAVIIKNGQDLLGDNCYECALPVSVTPLYHAVRLNRGLSLIKALVEVHDQDVNFNLCASVPTYMAKRVNAMVMCPTPLFWAFLHGNYEVAQYLIGKGARIDITNSCGKTPIDMAKNLRDPDFQALEKEMQV